MSFSIQELASQLGGQIQGSGDPVLTDVAPLESADPHHLSYADSRKQLSKVMASRAGAVLVHPELAGDLRSCTAARILVPDPQGAFIAAMLLFRPQRPRRSVGISERAIVAETARLGADCNVFPGAIIGEDVVIGDRCDIGPGVVIGDGCRIGNDCIIHASTVLYPDVAIGNRVIIHASAVIGADGFGYRFVQGAFQKIPHTGTVILEDDVEIGACATIDRAMIGATLIGQGTKLDNQVMVAHNCRVGRHNAFASHVGLAGSVTTGDYVQMAGQVGIADHCHIGSGVRLGGKAGVRSDLPGPGNYHGIPAIPERDALRNHLNVSKLPALKDQVKQLSARIAELEAQLSQLSPPARQSSAA